MYLYGTPPYHLGRVATQNTGPCICQAAIWRTERECFFQSKVLALHDEMRRCGIEIGGFIHHAAPCAAVLCAEWAQVAHACAATGGWERSLEVLEHCKHSAEVRGSVASSCAAAHQWQRVLRLLEQTQRPNLQLCQAALKSCVDGGQWARALDLLRSADRFGTPEPSLFNLAMASCAAAGQWGTVHLLFEEMQKKHISMDAESYRLSRIKSRLDGHLTSEDWPWRPVRACSAATTWWNCCELPKSRSACGPITLSPEARHSRRL